MVSKMISLCCVVLLPPSFYKEGVTQQKIAQRNGSVENNGVKSFDTHFRHLAQHNGNSWLT